MAVNTCPIYQNMSLDPALGRNFRWRVRPTATAANRRMIADLVGDELTRNSGRFPANTACIEVPR